MKICKCGYKTDNPAFLHCDKCGSILRSIDDADPDVRYEHGDGDVAYEMPVIYRSDVSLGGVFFIIFLCLAAFSGYTIYKAGLPQLVPEFLTLSIGLIVSLILITVVCLITANVMGISFGTMGSFILKMIAIILVADIIMLFIPVPYVGPILSFVIFIAMVERYFKLQWDGLIAFTIIVSIVYILGRLWLHGLINFLIEHLAMNVVIVWRFILLMLST
jgi:hypothetical protein